ncbi:non-hydrolyzing UDP-N-acetylglucosamine 2-epimerase [Lacibacterium aquatile]|uniref:Non-hydrolyzing UDP-N-acetylglucosamine 2-epimerase n=1 Tax=Lacibacterium aquatile TaxID=1168082 RepID=A0ABW5DXP3_9PROT
MIRILTVVGARPQFIKAAPLSLEMQRRGTIEEISVHTGQHFDENMSGIFFRDLKLPSPRYNLGISGGTHGVMTGRMLEAIEKILLDEKPDMMLVYGDTNSTLAAGLAAAKLNIPVAHVEAGLRSFNRAMPEEINRVMVDHVSELLLCPTATAINHLATEGITSGVHLVGDLMFDAVLALSDAADRTSTIHADLGLERKRYAAATIHRAENTDSKERLEAVIEYTLDQANGLDVVLPLHPRTRQSAERLSVNLDRKGLRLVDPLGYLDMLVLSKGAAMIFTDSGGLQKEAYFHRVPCVTLRDETEWTETLDAGWNRLWTVPEYKARREISDYGTGNSAGSIVDILEAYGTGEN